MKKKLCSMFYQKSINNTNVYTIYSHNLSSFKMYKSNEFSSIK